MSSQIHYLLRSQIDGSYIAAHPDRGTTPDKPVDVGYLLLFKENFDALTYINKYAPDLKERVAVESIPGSQLGAILNRWGFTGVGIVQDPLLPRVEFLTKS
jgi:hypothetical protein